MLELLADAHDILKAYRYQARYEQHVTEAAGFIRRELPTGDPPAFGLVLGSGLGDLADAIEVKSVLQYSDIPRFPQTTVEGHEGEMLIGSLEGVPLIAMKGRKHFYEVADQPFNTGTLQVIFPVNVLASLGVENYFITNAAGGLNLSYDVGDIMIIRSHINAITNPLLGRVHDLSRIDGTPQARFPPMNGLYNAQLRGLLAAAGREHEGHVHTGTYLGVTGPSYETEAECIAFRDGLRADAVGMSTVKEAVQGHSRGMRIVGMSCITNKIAEDGTNATDHEEVKRILSSPTVRHRLGSTVQNFFSLYREAHA